MVRGDGIDDCDDDQRDHVYWRASARLCRRRQLRLPPAGDRRFHRALPRRAFPGPAVLRKRVLQPVRIHGGPPGAGRRPHHRRHVLPRRHPEPGRARLCDGAGAGTHHGLEPDREHRADRTVLDTVDMDGRHRGRDLDRFRAVFHFDRGRYRGAHLRHGCVTRWLDHAGRGRPAGRQVHDPGFRDGSTYRVHVLGGADRDAVPEHGRLRHRSPVRAAPAVLPRPA